MWGTMTAAPMEFDEKARENLEAVDRLLPDDDGVRDCLANAVANRAYYAAYHAVAHVAQARDVAFTSEKGYYRHDTLPDDAVGSRILTQDRALDLEDLYALRIKADYHDDPVEREEADRAAGLAKALVEELL